MKLVIGNKNYSSWSLRPWLLLRQAGIDFEEVQVRLFTGSFAAEIARSTSAVLIVKAALEPRVDNAEGGSGHQIE